MATRHKLGSSSPRFALSRPDLGWARPVSGRLAHLPGMETNNAPSDLIEPVLSLSELAQRLRVSVQTLYDLRSQGRASAARRA